MRKIVSCAMFGVFMCLWGSTGNCLPAGQAGLPVLPANVSPASEKAFTFEGQLDVSRNHFEFNLSKATDKILSLSVDKVFENSYKLSAVIHELATPFFKLSTEFDGLLTVTGQRENAIMKGTLASRYTLLDYKPVGDMTAQFEIYKGNIHILSLTAGQIALKGTVDTVNPFALNLQISLDAMPMKEFVNFWTTDEDYEAEGVVSGNISVSGTLNAPYLKGNVESHDGFVDKLKYNYIHLIAEGFFPKLNIFDSVLAEPDGISFQFDGPVDLSDQEHFKAQLKALNTSALTAKIAGQSEWTIKEVQSKDGSKTQLKYMLRKEGSEADNRFKDETNMLGVQRTMEF